MFTNLGFIKSKCLLKPFKLLVSTIMFRHRHIWNYIFRVEALQSNLYKFANVLCTKLGDHIIDLIIINSYVFVVLE